MKIRTGRKNPHTLYLQVGTEPSDDDLRIGFMISPVEARLLAGATVSAAHLDGIRMAAEARIREGR